MKKGINFGFVAILLAFLTVSLVRTLVFPYDINEYENRKAEQVTDVTLSAFLDGSLQDQMEKSFADQALFARTMKKGYNETLSSYLRRLVVAVAERSPGRYIRLGEHYIMGADRLVFGPSRPEYMEGPIKKRSASINRLLENYPDTDFYLYYIEKDTDVNFKTGERAGAFDFLSQYVNLPAEKMDYFRVEDFDDFCAAFYKTDHHWNGVGAQRGYEEVVQLLEPTAIPMMPIEEVTLKQPFSGSKAQGKETSGFSESFTAYRYSHCPMDVIVHGQPMADYGMQEEYLNGLEDEVSYGLFYGIDWGEIVFDTHRPDLESVLLIGESYDNAILKLLANHFDKTVSVDLRYYEPYMKKPFSLKETMEAYEIDKVLLIGNIDFFIADDFILEE